MLPSLFAVSLPVTAVAAPAAAAFLGRRGVSRDRAVHQLYRLLAVSMLGGRHLLQSMSAPLLRVVGQSDSDPCLG